MQRQVFSTDTEGRPCWTYIDQPGVKAKPVKGRGRPTGAVVVSSDGIANTAVGAGRRQMPLRRAA